MIVPSALPETPLPCKPIAAPVEPSSPCPQPPPRDGVSRRHHITQNTAEWDAWRGMCDLTASDAPALCGSGIGYKSAAELYHEKRTGVAPEMSAFAKEAAQRGHRLEPLALHWLDKQTGKHHRKGQFYTRWIELKWLDEKQKKRTRWALLGASPDAEYDDEEETVIEIKCPLNSTKCSAHSADDNERKKFWRFWIQVQFQLFVMGRKNAILCVWHPELPANVFRVWFLEKWWQEFFIPRLVEHVRNVDRETPPTRQKPGHLLELFAWATRLGSPVQDSAGELASSASGSDRAAFADDAENLDEPLDDDDAPILRASSAAVATPRKRKRRS